MDREVRPSPYRRRSDRVLERSFQLDGAWAVGRLREPVFGKEAQPTALRDQVSGRSVRRPLAEAGQEARARAQLGPVNSWPRQYRPWGRTSE